MANNKTVASGACGTITLMKNSDSKVRLYSSGANTFSLNISGDENFAKFAGNDKVKFVSNVKSNLSVAFEVFSMPLLSVMFGMTGTTGVTSLFTNHLEKSPTTTITLPEAPKAGSLFISKMEIGDNESLLDGGELVDGDPVNVGEYSISGTDITLNASDLTNPIRCFYMKDSEATATRYDFNAVEASKTEGYTISFVFDWTDANNGDIVPMHLIANNFQPSISTGIDFSAGSVASIEMTADLLPDDDGNNYSLIQI